MKLTPMQTEMLTLLDGGCRYLIKDERIVRNLQRKGLARYIEKMGAWCITAKGQRVYARIHAANSADGPQSMMREGV